MFRRRRTLPSINSPDPKRTIDAGSGTTGSEGALTGAAGKKTTGGATEAPETIGVTGGDIIAAVAVCAELPTDETVFTFRLATGEVNWTVPSESEIAAADALSAVATAAPAVELEGTLDGEQLAGLHEPKATAMVPPSPAEIASVVEPELVKLTGVWA